MSRYELYLFLHITAAALWVGGGFMLTVLAIQADKSGGDATLANTFRQMNDVAEKVLVPSSLGVLILGLLMIFDGPWNFEPLWIVLGLIGYFGTFVLGLFVMSPIGKRIGEQLEAEGVTPRNATEVRKFLMLARIDTLLLFVIIADMAIKPTGDDVGILIAMAAVVLLGVGYVITRMRALDAQSAATPATATG